MWAEVWSCWAHRGAMGHWSGSWRQVPVLGGITGNTTASLCQSPGVRGPLGFYCTKAVARSIAALSLAEYKPVLLQESGRSPHLRVCTRCLRRLVTTLSPGEESGSHFSGAWSHADLLHRKNPLLCMNFTGLWLFVIKWDKQHFYGQRVVFCSSSAMICSCAASQPLGCCMWCIIDVPLSDGSPGPVMHLLIIKLGGSLSLYFHCIYARINFCSW